MSAGTAPFVDHCSFKSKVKVDLGFPHVLKHVTVEAYHYQHGRIGDLYGYCIDRALTRVRGDFHQIMDCNPESSELVKFATTLFDKRGRLKSELVVNEYQKGTGAFGRELDDGILLLIIAVRVRPEVRA